MLLEPLFPLAGFLVFLPRRALTYLHIFQQEEYDNKRFICWMMKSLSVDRKASALIIALAILSKFSQADTALITSTALGAGLIFLALREADPRQAGKKKLVLTKRASRILLLALVLGIVLALALTAALGWEGLLDTRSAVLWWLLPVQAVPFLLVLANLLLAPYEIYTQRKFWREAHNRLLRLNPYTIGITGSFGKTSVKHILGHILELNAPTLITPGSVNTPMGVARIIREQLMPEHTYFVVEMGAYGPGSIGRLCRLAPPRMGIITAIGHAHYERFKTLDAVARTKFELADATAAVSGHVVVNRQVLGFPYPQEFAEKHPGSLIICSDTPTDNLQLLETKQTADGLSVDIRWQGQSYTLAAPIYGAHHAQNIAISFAAACTLGITPQKIITALKSLPQIKHRLEVRQLNSGCTVIDDAYNSNPQGFENALSLLNTLKKPHGRRILVTPGMVELGAAHSSEHARLGAFAAAHADIALVVNAARIPSFVSAFTGAAPAEAQLHTVPDFAAAQAWLDVHATPADVILLENDLPDLYERKWTL